MYAIASKMMKDYLKKSLLTRGRRFVWRRCTFFNFLARKSLVECLVIIVNNVLNGLKLSAHTILCS